MGVGNRDERERFAAYFDSEDPDDISYTGKIGSVRKRHEKILEMVQKKGFVTIESFAQEFRVTPQTIRRDINMLSDEGLLNRYHGGAGLASSTENVEYDQRKVMSLKEKQKI